MNLRDTLAGPTKFILPKYTLIKEVPPKEIHETYMFLRKTLNEHIDIAILVPYNEDKCKWQQ